LFYKLMFRNDCPPKKRQLAPKCAIRRRDPLRAPQANKVDDRA
jgi:hypothetical protein